LRAVIEACAAPYFVRHDRMTRLFEEPGRCGRFLRAEDSGIVGVAQLSADTTVIVCFLEDLAVTTRITGTDILFLGSSVRAEVTDIEFT